MTWEGVTISLFFFPNLWSQRRGVGSLVPDPGPCIRGSVEGKAASHLRPRLGDGAASPLATCDEIFDFLRSVFRDRNARRRAREQLDNLTLGRGAPFYEFHGEFVRLATEAGLALDEWKDRLEGKLSFRIRSATARAFNNDAVTFDEYVQEVSEQ